MKSSLLLLGLFWYLLSPLPPGIAINPETKECGDYFGGDEYGGYVLPSPWEVIYDPTIHTASGEVKWEGSTEEYCRQIGYTYVAGELGKTYGKFKNTNIFYIFLVIYLLPLILAGVLIYSLYSFISKKRARSQELHSLETEKRE